MRISFDKFKQIFWMVIATIFIVLFAFYAFQSLYSYKVEKVGGYAVTVMSRLNKITGKKYYRAFTEEWETKWTTIGNLSNEIKKIGKLREEAEK